MANYINHQLHAADSYWERRHFIRRWWSQQRQDTRWTPPHVAALQPFLHPQRAFHLARAAPLFMHMDGLARRGSSMGSGSPAFESTLATALLLMDPQRADRTAYLSHFDSVNDLDSLETFFYFLSEKLWERGIHKAIGPCMASPHLQCGALMDSFNLAPPLHTPYNAPYLPELLQSVMQPIEERHLYHIHIAAETASSPAPGPAQLSPLDPTRLARSLLPLFQAACAISAHFPPPDSREAEFILRQIMLTPTRAWVARIQRQPVGFVLLQPDMGFALRRANGGRNWLWRRWLHWRSERPVTAGRILYWGVLSAWRGQGIGQQLLAHAINEAARRGWRSLTVGPLPTGNLGAMLLRKIGGKPVQRYQLFETGF
ncbi:MAG: GNAT family N-acetyltransferase [Caldilineaceae bacterium]